jgi:dihydrolipoamide dehydrogenase
MVGRFPFQSNGRALAGGEFDGFVKVIAEKDLGQVLGIHILADHATDLIGGPALGLALEVTAEELGKTVQAHPTLNEALSEAGLDVLKEAIHLPKKK